MDARDDKRRPPSPPPMPSKMEEEDEHELTDLTNTRGGNKGHGNEDKNDKAFSTSLVFVFLTRKGNGN
jgi:hypothetical protein